MTFASRHCRHYSWDIGPRCAVGVDIDRPMGTLPCMPAGVVQKPFVPCPKREDYTPDEIEARRAKQSARMDRVFQCMAAIPNTMNDRRAWGTSGTVECPACKGTIEWSRARRNGHLWAKCSTPDCFAVIQ